MSEHDPMAPMMSQSGVADAVAAATAAINRAHRRPAGLRKPEIISAESLVRGARATSAAGMRPVEELDALAGPELSAYSHLAPELLATTVRTFARAPLQVLAKVAVSAGGAAESADADLAQRLAVFITQGTGPSFDRLAPAVVHLEIAASELFGPHSEVVARVAGRAMAVHTGLDPRGFAVPEVYLRRHRQAYGQALADYRQGRAAAAVVFILRAWEAGGQEADAIAQAV
ncbi:oxidoreductase [Corynebacterium lizhenjunii]|uniref:Oxidoreductase n=1 Tax=Corynebacterium lizhenjunii TaxID=2709394 RepID=A0A7T0KEJ4_9CORY|nr:oxidoreductase [Corynebacterium lizhenjunii]QPK79343.1 oxidoreductase [Corynebacterium lizhenjunii]